MDLRRLAKELAASTIDHSGLRRLIGHGRRIAAGGRRIVVLGYHRVCTDLEAERTRAIESCLISQSTFAEHVEFLKRHFELTTMSRAVDVMTGATVSSRDI